MVGQYNYLVGGGRRDCYTEPPPDRPRPPTRTLPEPIDLAAYQRPVKVVDIPAVKADPDTILPSMQQVPFPDRKSSNKAKKLLCSALYNRENMPPKQGIAHPRKNDSHILFLIKCMI